MKYLIYALMAAASVAGASCRESRVIHAASLREEVSMLVNSVPGTVGVAFVSNDDTITINNGVNYAMMSVFKLHQSLAAANALARKGISLDTLVHIGSGEIDRDTWSPMLKKYNSADIDVSAAELMRYAITMSDNNASNAFFHHIISPRATDRFLKSIVRDTTFSIVYSEAEMKANHDKSYLNYTSPLSAALLIKQVFEESMIDKAAQDSIRRYLSEVTTGQDRLGAVVSNPDIILFGHKTGSGYRNAAGELMAHNDVGYFRRKDGHNYSLAVFICDFRGTEDEASKIIAKISRCVDRAVSGASKYARKP